MTSEKGSRNSDIFLLRSFRVFGVFTGFLSVAAEGDKPGCASDPRSKTCKMCFDRAREAQYVVDPQLSGPAGGRAFFRVRIELSYLLAVYRLMCQSWDFLLYPGGTVDL